VKPGIAQKHLEFIFSRRVLVHGGFYVFHDPIEHNLPFFLTHLYRLSYPGGSVLSRWLTVEDNPIYIVGDTLCTRTTQYTRNNHRQ
jgi:hypothetical protein